MTGPKLLLVDRNSTPYANIKVARKEGNVPGVLYSKGKETQLFYVNQIELLKMFKTYGSNRKVAITLNNVTTSAIVKDYQKESMKNEFVHLDLQALDENEKIKANSSIHITHREEVEKQDKILQVQMNEVEIQMYPRFMPESVEVDARLLLEKDNLTLADLNIANDENIEFSDSLDTVIATLVYAQVEKEAEEEAETTEVPAAEATETKE